eukprot:14492622-Alexandrium_andersonii.AAC.1
MRKGPHSIWENGATFHMADIGDPFSCSSGCQGRCAKRGARRAQHRNLVVADFGRFRAWDKD